jgi:hypothetical protein
MPVAYTTQWRSPCLIVDPAKAVSELNFLTGRDSPCGQGQGWVGLRLG